MTIQIELKLKFEATIALWYLFGSWNGNAKIPLQALT